MRSKNKHKRQKPSNSDSDSEEHSNSQRSSQSSSQTSSQSILQSQPSKAYVPRFLVITSTEEGKSIASLSPFVIYKTIQSIAGEVKNIKTLRSGQLLVECDREAHERNLRKVTTFFNVPCKVELHETLNSSKGIIRCAALKGHSDEYILEEMREQGVTAVRRIHIRRDGILKPTNTFVLTFNTPVLPQHTKVGYLRVAVDIYIPNPLRCYRCQSFGHHEDRCTRPKVCVNCGEPDHINATSGQCTRPAKCCNCTGAHSANSRDCTTWQKEKKIVKLKYEQNISFQEARGKIEEEYSRPTTTYANVTKTTANKATQTADKETQTEADSQTDTNTKKDKVKTLKPQTVQMIRKDMAKSKQRERIQTARRERSDIEGKVTKASENLHTLNKNPYSVLEQMEDDSVIFSESSPGVPKGTLNRLTDT